MFNYYDTTQLIKDLDVSISVKEKERELLENVINSDIMTKIKIQQLTYEINEMRVQRTYYSNKMTDELMNNSIQTCGKCKYCKAK